MVLNMASSTVENYVKQLYLEQQRRPGGLVAMGRLAQLMQVVPGTATTMMKALADAGLASYRPRTGVKLTRGGEQLALHVLRRHRLIELFLVKVLGFDWADVHPEAEELEHAISDKVLERIDALLGHPTSDPHGDPIPTAGGHLQAPNDASLLNCLTGCSLRVTRVIDQQAAFLRFLERTGLMPGAEVTVIRRDAAADTVEIQRGSAVVTIGRAAAASVRVAPLGGHPTAASGRRPQQRKRSPA